MVKEKVIDTFKNEFGFIKDKFEIIDLLENNSPMDYKTIDSLKLPNEKNNIVWHPGVYLFIGNNSVYRVGVSLKNSRYRVLQHLEARTSNDKFSIWDIDLYQDKAILLFNVKKTCDRHWLLAVEVFLENKFKPLIKAKRIG